LVTITCLHSFPARFIVFYICVCLFLTRSGLADHSILTKCKFMRRLGFDACSAATVFTTTTRWVPASFRRDRHPLQGSRRPSLQLSNATSAEREDKYDWIFFCIISEHLIFHIIAEHIIWSRMTCLALRATPAGQCLSATPERGQTRGFFVWPDACRGSKTAPN
jgi:hypothetical protein